MPDWSIEFQFGAEKDLAKIERAERRRILDKISWLAENFENVVPQPLEGEWADFYKLRVGDWRIKYKLNQKKFLITVCYIGWRDKAYKKIP